MPDFPERGQEPYGPMVKAYIDSVAQSTLGFVVLDYGAPVPTDPVDGTIYVRKTSPDSIGSPDDRQSVPSVANIGTHAQGTLASAPSLSVPSGTQAGDLLVMALALAPGSVSTITMPTGWTQRITGTAGTSSWSQLEVWTKVAEATDSTISITSSTASGKWCGVILDCTGDFDNASTVSASASSSSSYTTPDTAISDDVLALAFVTDRGAGVAPNDGIPSDTWTMAAGFSLVDSYLSSPQTSGNVSLMVGKSTSLIDDDCPAATFAGNKINTRGCSAILALHGVSS